jgi:glucosamine-6-phosphate deaminase
MEIVILPTPEEVVQFGSEIVIKQVHRKPDSVLGLATGATMEGVYSRLRHLDLSQVTTFNLDEYVALSHDDPCSYAAYMKRHLFEYTPVKKAHLLDGTAEDVPAHCANYEAAIRESGGIDLQLLGIGTDGHIAFNEPGSSLVSRTRLKILTKATRKANAKHFALRDKVPPYVLTMGVGTIMEARHCLLLTYGPHKAKAVAGAVEGGISAFCPASALQMHPKCTFVMDEEAASELQLKDYYKSVFELKPEWMK